MRMVPLGPLICQRHEIDKLIKAEAPVVIPVQMVAREGVVSREPWEKE